MVEGLRIAVALSAVLLALAATAAACGIPATEDKSAPLAVSRATK
jgi:hypothetical protein